jgi:hypothetical protein
VAVTEPGSAAEPPPAIPARLGGYRMLEPLGAGATGWVYRAVEEASGAPAAVKVLHPHLAGQPGFRERFEREARVAAMFRSPNVVRVLGHGDDGRLLYLVMELVEGRSLKDVLRDGPLGPARAVETGLAIAAALEEAEALGVTHRDIKPENVIIATDGVVRVVDFGLARDAASAESITASGNALGSVAYMAWEQAAGRADRRTDIYALGATLYHALTGAPPFTGDLFDVLVKHRETPPPEAPLAAVPGPLARVVLRCLEKDPARRFQSAAEVSQALRDASGDSRAGPPKAVAPRRAAAIVLAVTAAAVAVAALVLLLARPWEDSRPAEAGPGGQAAAAASPSASAAAAPVSPELTSPAPGSVLASPDVRFSWTAGTGVTKYDLWIGTSHNTGDIFDMDDGPALSAMVTGLPMDGRTLYVRLLGAAGEELVLTQHSTFTVAGAGWPRETFTFTLDPRLVLDTGIDLHPGDTVAVTASGSITINSRGQPRYSPGGDAGCPDASMPARLLPKKNCWSLIASVGDGPYFFVGESFARSGLGTGRLQFAVNDDNQSDNAGSFAVSVTVTRGGS